MLPINPNSLGNLSSLTQVLRWAQSVYKVLNGGTQIVTPATQNAAGVYNTFNQDNFNGLMVRIGPTESVTWTSSSGATAINHGLQKQPIGFIICDKDKTCDIWQTNTPTSSVISLACSDATAEVTLFIF
jgi:hypothetical protein